MQLRPYQEEAKQAILGEWNKGINRTLLVLPTGCGKTIVFAKVTEEQVKQGDRVLILAHRFELLQQACDKIEQATGLKSAMEKAEYTCMFRRDELERFRPSPNHRTGADRYPHSRPCPPRSSG